MNITLIVEFIIALATIIFVHEFGHFIVLKLVKIDVEEFGFGYPPRLLTLFELGGTKFTLNLLPFGGFVRMKGDTDPKEPGGFAAASPWKRITALIAGPVMNLLIALILFIIIDGLLGTLPDRRFVQLQSIIPDTPASAAGLQAGDILVSIGGVRINSPDKVQNVIHSNLGKPLVFVYERNGLNQEVTITPLANPGSSPAVGFYMGYPNKPFTIWGAMPESFNFMGDYLKQLFTLVGGMIRGQTTSSNERFIGLKGMYDLYSWVVQSPSTPGVPTIANVLFFFSTISISLGLFNLLPFPALDGGRIAFVLPEIFINRRIPAKYENWVNLIGFALLILLMIYINAQDFIHPLILTPTP